MSRDYMRAPGKSLHGQFISSHLISVLSHVRLGTRYIRQQLLRLCSSVEFTEHNSISHWSRRHDVRRRCRHSHACVVTLFELVIALCLRFNQSICAPFKELLRVQLV